MMPTIELTRDLETKISARDLYWLSGFKWYAHMSKWKKAYAARKKPGGGVIYMHRFIMNAPKGKLVDHINGDSLDNQRENLRICDYSDNSHNVDCDMGEVDYRGVSKRGTRYEAQISKNGKRIYIGTYITPEEAALAYDVKARRMFGEHAKVNFKDDKLADSQQKQ